MLFRALLMLSPACQDSFQFASTALSHHVTSVRSSEGGMMESCLQKEFKSSKGAAISVSASCSLAAESARCKHAKA